MEQATYYQVTRQSHVEIDVTGATEFLVRTFIRDYVREYPKDRFKTSFGPAMMDPKTGKYRAFGTRLLSCD